MRLEALIGNALRQARLMHPRRMSQLSLARHLGISRPSVNRYENGKQPLSAVHLLEIASLFDIDLNLIVQLLPDERKRAFQALATASEGLGRGQAYRARQNRSTAPSRGKNHVR